MNKYCCVSNNIQNIKLNIVVLARISTHTFTHGVSNIFCEPTEVTQSARYVFVTIRCKDIFLGTLLLVVIDYYITTISLHILVNNGICNC